MPKRIDIEGCPGEGAYLSRWHLIGHEKSDFHVMLHRFNRSDRDREMHDHPWPFISIILWGGYTEVTPGIDYLKREILKRGGERIPFSAMAGHRLRRRFYWPGSVLFRRARWAHRIEIDRPAFSLVIAFKKQRSWGFFTSLGWKPWRDFIATRDCADA